MHWPFQCLDQGFNLVVAEALLQPEGKRCNDKALAGLILLCRTESFAQEAIYGGLKRAAGAADFFLDQPGYVVVDGEGGSHIMMLFLKAS